MITGNYDDLMGIADRSVCPEHNLPLVVAWYSPGKTYVLRCGADHYPDNVKRELSLTEEYKRGTALPNHIEKNIKRRVHMQEKQEMEVSTAQTLGGVPASDLATGKLLTVEQIQALVQYAKKYKLDPYRSHVVMMYGDPYITLDGYLYHASRQGKPYNLISRPLITTERAALQLGERDHGWFAELDIAEGLGHFVGTGIVTEGEMSQRSAKDTTKLAHPVVAAHPWQLAQKRAEWQALRRAFPIGEE